MKANLDRPSQIEASKSAGEADREAAPAEPVRSADATPMQPLQAAVANHEAPGGLLEAGSGRSKTPGLALVRLLVGVGALGALVLVWWAIAALGNYPAFILPTPLAVAQRFWAVLLDGTLLPNFAATVVEAALGFLVALVVGVGLGYLIAHSPLLEKVTSPYIAVSQGLPVIAVAPLLVIWLQNDLARTVTVAALIVFFPVLVNTIVGVRGIDRAMLEVARISGANLWQTVLYVELPLSLHTLLGGIRLGMTLSITGAIVGEFVAPNAGLGYLLMLARGQFDTALIFVSLAMLALMAVLAYGSVTLLEKLLITWE